MLSLWFANVWNSILIGVVIACALVITVIFIGLHLNKKKKLRHEAAKQDGAAFEQRLNQGGFKVCRSASMLSSILYVDDDAKKWCLKTGSKSLLKVYAFSDLLGYERSSAGTNVYLHIRVDDPQHATRSIRFESGNYSLEEKTTMLNSMTELLDYILGNK